VTSDAGSAEHLASAGRETGVGPESLRSYRGMEADLVAGMVASRVSSGAFTEAFRTAFIALPRAGDHALWSGWLSYLRGEHPGKVDAGIRLCDVPRVPGIGRAGADELLDQHKVKT
jgi:hypothetical protein